MNVIQKATALGLPLIGSTALKLYSQVLGVKPPREPRDTDFICYSAESNVKYRKFRTWCILNSIKHVDVYSVADETVFKYTTVVNGVLTLTLPALFYRLLERNTPQSLKDCKWILSLPDNSFSDEEFQDTLQDLGIDDELLNRFNKLYE